MKTIIIHADDAGISRGANEAIQDLVGLGLVHSSSVLTKSPYAREFADPDYDLGLHVCLVETQLHDHRLVYNEMSEQWELLRSWGVMPSHIDSHTGNALVHRPAVEAYFQFCLDHQTPPLLAKEAACGHLRHVISFAEVARAIEGKNFYQLDGLWILPEAASLEEKIQKLDAILNLIPSGVTQILVHPNLDTEQGRWDCEALKARAPQIRSIKNTNWKKLKQGNLLI